MEERQKQVTVTVKVDERVKTLLGKCAAEVGLSLSQYVRNIIYCKLMDYSIMPGLKLLKLDHLKIYSQAVPGEMDLGSDVPEVSREVNISVIVGEDVKGKLLKISTDLGLTLKQVARNFIYLALYEHDLLRKLRMIRIAKIANGFMASIGKLYQSHKT